VKKVMGGSTDPAVLSTIEGEWLAPSERANVGIIRNNYDKHMLTIAWPDVEHVYIEIENNLWMT